MTPASSALGEASATHGRVVESLNDLLQIDHDAIAAYDVASEKLEDEAAAEQIRRFRQDHERHVSQLNEVVRSLGGTARNEPHPSGPFREALQSLGGLAGDKGVLMAWRTNELQVRNRYRGYLTRAVEWPAEARRVLERSAADEERHYRWVVDELERLGVTSREGARPPGTDDEGAADKLRDTLETTTRHMQDRASRAGARLREQLPSGDTGERLRQKVDGVTQHLRDSAEGANQQFLQVGEDLEGRVRRHPARTLLTAAVAGFVVGRLIR